MTCLRSRGQLVSESIGSPPITVALGPEFFLPTETLFPPLIGVCKNFSQANSPKCSTCKAKMGLPTHPRSFLISQGTKNKDHTQLSVHAQRLAQCLRQRRVVPELVSVQNFPEEQNLEKRGSLCKFCQKSSQRGLEPSSSALCPKPPPHSVSFVFYSLCLQFTNDLQI